MDNPFAVRTPESLTSEQVYSLFVNVFSDLPKLLDPSHTFIHGPRGSGKSMMLRYLEPDVQHAAGKNNLKAADFYAVHVPIRLANLTITEIERLKDSAYWAITEHLMVMHIAYRIFSSLEKAMQVFGISAEAEMQAFHEQKFKPLMELMGWSGTMEPSSSAKQICEREFVTTIKYLKRLSFTSEPLPYTGALCGYLDFLVPIIQEVRELSFMPQGPIFLLLDDADNLTLNMQKVLNTWVSCRTTNDVCLKISTQMRYKTYRSLNGFLIESPHDYSEIDLSTIYTSKRNHYYDRIKQIVERRLQLAGLEITAEEFFPRNEEQEKKIEEFAEALRQAHARGEGRGSRASDDVNRYARPSYMASLAGASKNSANFSYAGFKTLVDISSGIIRYFLDPAARMYSAIISEGANQPNHIPHSVQDKAVKEWSEEFVLLDFEKLKSTQMQDGTTDVDLPRRLVNLVRSMGEAFRQRILNKEHSERRILSVMVPELTPQLEQVFNLGIEWGYFQASTVTSKEGGGRKRIYLLNRRLTPYFKLDPSYWAGHMSVTLEHLEIACNDPQRFVKLRIDQDKEDIKKNSQPGLFSDNLGGANED